MWGLCLFSIGRTCMVWQPYCEGLRWGMNWIGSCGLHCSCLVEQLYDVYPITCTGASRGFAFVEFQTVNAAQQWMEHNQVLQTHQIFSSRQLAFSWRALPYGSKFIQAFAHRYMLNRRDLPIHLCCNTLGVRSPVSNVQQFGFHLVSIPELCCCRNACPNIRNIRNYL